MILLHTADWHLGDWLGRIDRTQDLRRGVETIAKLCERHDVDVLLIAGDLFSERNQPDALRRSIEHLQACFTPFLRRGGTILALTGNHDNETFCRTLSHISHLVAPEPPADPAEQGEGRTLAPPRLLPTGRFYLATRSRHLRLADRRHPNRAVSFVLMPYPTISNSFDGSIPPPRGGFDEKARALRAAFLNSLAQLRDSLTPEEPETAEPAVLAAHAHLESALAAGLYRLSQSESLLMPDEPFLHPRWSYVALGHIHLPQMIANRPHVRYSGPLERLDLSEADEPRGAVLVDLEPAFARPRQAVSPVFLPLDPTPIRRVVIHDPATEIPRLAEIYPDAARSLVNYDLTYTPGTDLLDDLRDQIEAVFPRWYNSDWHQAGEMPLNPSNPDASTINLTDEQGTALNPTTSTSASATISVRETVLRYLETVLPTEHTERAAVLALAEQFLDEDEPQITDPREVAP